MPGLETALELRDEIQAFGISGRAMAEVIAQQRQLRGEVAERWTGTCTKLKDFLVASAVEPDVHLTDKPKRGLWGRPRGPYADVALEGWSIGKDRDENVHMRIDGREAVYTTDYVLSVDGILYTHERYEAVYPKDDIQFNLYGSTVTRLNPESVVLDQKSRVLNRLDEFLNGLAATAASN